MQRRRPPPRLRTKTGCFKCRLRRKKCDEIRPRCGGCCRQNFDCVYPTNPRAKSPTHSSNSFSKFEGCAIPATDLELCWSSLPIEQPTDFTFATEDWLLYYFHNAFTPILIRSHAHPIYQDSSYLCTLQNSAEWVRSAFLANAASHASSTIPYLRPWAMMHYSKAVSSLQMAIDEGQVDGSEDSTLAAVVFLLLFEKSHSEPSSLVSTHLRGLAHLMRMRSRKSTHNSSTSQILPFHRLSTESFAYQIATLSFLSPEIRALAPLFSWDELGATMCVKLLPGDLEYSASPLLGRHRNLFKLIYEVSCLCGQDNIPEDRAREARGQDDNLEAMLEELDKTSSSCLDLKDEDLTYENETKLYIISTQLLTFKLQEPNAPINHPRIRSLSDTALTLLRLCKVSTLCSDFFCWPVLILGYNVLQEKDMHFLNEKLVELWQTSYCGQIKRTAAVLNDVWNFRRRQRRLGGSEEGHLLSNASDPFDELLDTQKSTHPER
ncbi:fungal-specific transcription factor domain-containing protein [Leptodontidium sp. 2 PMI_412]|nr:fungal-specific transcription factor domain-containing protein [Leptodontidium sp. 2 PMI_412]